VSTSRGPEVASAPAVETAGRRRQARERALGLLYEADIRSVRPAEVLSGLAALDDFALRLVEGVDAHAAEIDEVISELASGWTLDRMPALDRNVLRLATFELLHLPEVPVAVVIDEAVELAKSYSTEDSGRYVNGVLAAVAARFRG
jgi:transcription antitermination protein NusB